MKGIKVNDNDWEELSHLKIDLKYKNLAQTISYLLYELNKNQEKYHLDLNEKEEWRKVK